MSELRALLAHRLAARPTRANFRTGHLTVCTLAPMRSVPHRVVCLLGLDDGAFPRQAPHDGDDILLATAMAGDRDPRAEDRQMLLDALLAAQDRLIVTYTGNDECTNAPRPPAVVVSELLDIVDATARCEGGRARERVLIRHPLQPFDERNFLRGALVRERLWSFDPVALEGAQTLRGPRAAPAPLLGDPLPDAEHGVLELADLVAFVQRPARAFLRQRLGISITGTDDEVLDALPVELDALGRWGVGERLLEQLLAGVEPRAALLAEIGRGTLPPGELGRAVIQDVWPKVMAIWTSAQAYGGSSPPRSVEAVVALPGGPLLTGTVSGVRGSVLLSTTYSRLSARHRLAAWVRLLALTAARPEAPFEAVTVGRAGADAGTGARRVTDGEPPAEEVSIAQLSPLGRDALGRRTRAISLLADLVDLRARGMREPLPLPCLSAAAYAQSARSGPRSAAQAAAQAVWRPQAFGRTGESREPEHELDLRWRDPVRRAARAGTDRRRAGRRLGGRGDLALRPARPAAVGSAARVRNADAAMSVTQLSDEPFDLTGPLPTGVTVLEASAGTGKTYTIAALATRFIAAGIPLENLLLVTFTRMATGELRERVRERLQRTERELARTLAGAPSAGDAITDLLARGGAETVEVRRSRLAAAISDFDSATIATTHSFCQTVLNELGTLGDLEPDAQFVESIDDVLGEVIDDLYLRRFWRPEAGVRSRSGSDDRPHRDRAPDRDDPSPQGGARERRSDACPARAGDARRARAP